MIIIHLPGEASRLRYFMEHIYTSYCKKIADTNYFFVKKYQVFPEFANIAPVLESFGMHTNFERACSIAAITEKSIREKLLAELNGSQNTIAKVIKLPNEKEKKRRRIKLL